MKTKEKLTSEIQNDDLLNQAVLRLMWREYESLSLRVDTLRTCDLPFAVDEGALAEYRKDVGFLLDQLITAYNDTREIKFSSFSEKYSHLIRILLDREREYTLSFL
jgi:hypothetical protein